MVSEREIPNFRSSSRQAVFLCIGQAGCQIGSTVWALFNEEHGVLPDGIGLSFNTAPCPHLNFYKDSLYYKDDEFHRMFSYFQTKDTERFVPRNLFIDLESTVIDEIKSGVYRRLFSNDLSYFQFTKMGDGSSLFPRAYNSIGRFIIYNVMDSIRHLAEKTDQLSVFNIIRSYGGGTGSGLGSLILENLADNYSKVILSETNILNSGLKDSPTLEPFNTLFGVESSCTCSGITVLYNNKALQNICFKRLGIKKPVYITNNQLIAYSVSGIYATERFPGYGNCNIDSMLTNLIPYPRIQFPFCTLAPITRKEIIKYEKYSAPSDLVSKIISDDYTMFDTNINSGSYISCCMIYRGMVSPGNIARSHQDLLNNKKIQFIEWNPNSIKNGHSPLGLVDLPNFDFGVSQLSMLMLANHTNINLAFAEQTLSVHIMLKKKAFLHWYYEYGIEEEDFHSAIENLILLNLDYKDIENKPIEEKIVKSSDLNRKRNKKISPKQADILFRKSNKRKLKELNAAKAEMLYNKPKDVADNKLNNENDPESMSKDIFVPCNTTTDTDDKNLNPRDSFLNETQAKISVIDNTEADSFHKSQNELDSTRNSDLKISDHETFTNIVHLKDSEESFSKSINPKQSITKVTYSINKENMALENPQELVKGKFSKKMKKSKSANSLIERGKARRHQISAKSNQMRCSLSLFKTYEESFVSNITPKIAFLDFTDTLKAQLDCAIAQPNVVTNYHK